MDPAFPFTANVAQPGRLARKRAPSWDQAKKDQLKSLWLADADDELIADLLETSSDVVRKQARALGLPPRNRRGADAPREGRRWLSWTAARQDRLKEMWTDGATGKEMAKALSTSTGAVYRKAHELGLPKRQRGGRRRKADVIAIGMPDGARIQLDDWHPAVTSGRTIHPRTVVPASRVKNILKSGEHDHKIGKIAKKGRWKGFPLFKLTREERASCPTSCSEWKTCYGNNLGHMTIERIVDDGALAVRLRSQVIYLAATSPQGFAVRLHFLGDFDSVEYVAMWRDLLADFPALHVFGFTARRPDDEIGRAVIGLMEEFDDRVMIRFSGLGAALMCSEVVDTPEQATGIICPAEIETKRDCATCGLCWTSDLNITFLRH